MKIVVIEDELLIAEDLIDILNSIVPECEIVAHISSVAEGKLFFEKSPKVDLIFSDIQLGDGLSFEIFKEFQPKAPVIFCTAYDTYAIEAFKVNGIDYILKPYFVKSIQNALDNYKRLKETFTETNENMSKTIDQMTSNPVANSTILVYHKEKIIPLSIDDIALAYIRNEAVYLRTFDGSNFIINKSLDDLDQMLGQDFYRANRQFIVNRRAVKDVTTFINRKYSANLIIEFKDPITISKEKITSFLSWLKND